MKRTIASTLAATIVLAASNAAAFESYVEAGLGFPEVIHIRAGGFVIPRLSVDLYGGIFLWNLLAGIGATGYLLGTARPDGPPRHSWIINGAFAINPTLFPPRLTSGGETAGAAFLFNTGYQFTADGGFLFRVYTGGILIWEEQLAGGPNLLAFGAGYKF